MPISRPLTKAILKKMFLKALHEHRRPGGSFASSAWSVGQILGSTIPHLFQLGRLSEEEVAIGRRAVYELEHDEYLWQDRTQSSPEFKELTPKGLRIVAQSLDDMQLPSVDIDQVLSRDDLREKVRDDFISGEYESAVFKAFRLLEESVRNKAGQPASAIGVNLMTTAFKPGASILKHAEAQVPSEEEALFYLMRGAIGWFKNPSSHRTVGYSDPEQAALILGFANLLLDLLDQCSV